LHQTRARERTGTVRLDRVRETGTGIYVEAESRWLPWLRTTAGMRADGYTFDVTSDRAANSGTRASGIVSPKLSLALAPAANVEIYASGGFGFHSNDARGTTITIDPATGDRAQAVSPLVRSRGAEIGLRFSPLGDWRSTLTAWTLDLDSELLFIGDGGATEPSAASRRRGVTWANYWRPLSALAIDADISFAGARFAGVPAGEAHVPGALESVLAAGIAWTPPGKGLLGALRVRSFGAYPLVEDNSVRASATTLLNGDAGYQFAAGSRIQLSVLNLLGARADDIQYFYRSRLRGEPAQGVDDVHSHPVEPRSVRLSLEWRF
jgi:hypothetical protein